MIIDDVIHDFAVAGNTLPRDSMRWALDNWDAAGPRFIDLLDRCTRGVDRTEATKRALFFIVHLLGERRETKAFPALCRLLKEADTAESILGDAIAENLIGILIGTYDGDLAMLQDAIESATSDEFARAAALQAMAYLTRTGALSDRDMRAYLLHLLAEMRPQASCFVWTAWALSAANLGYADYSGKVEQLIRRRFIPYRVMTTENFRRQLRRALDDPNRMAGFEHDQIGPFTDAIGTLSTWYAFSDRREGDRGPSATHMEETPAWPIVDEPYVNPRRQVGRNDPCPCGSGKKYKKCCLK